MMCCDLSAEVTGCLQQAIEKQEAVCCKRCPLAEKLSDQELLKENLAEVAEQEYEETLI
jgi:hypothetical protein